MQIDPSEAEAFVNWLVGQAIAEARGGNRDALEVPPNGRLWLGRIAPEVVVRNSRYGDKSERLEPCEIGVRVRPSAIDGRVLRCHASFVVWRGPLEVDEGEPAWRKSNRCEVVVELQAPLTIGEPVRGGRLELERELASLGAVGMSAEFQAELEQGKDGPELVVTLVNTSPEQLDGWDTNLYETELVVEVGATIPFTLESLPDSFRYDRRVPAYGVNCGVENLSASTFRTIDFSICDRHRPVYWDEECSGPKPDLTFKRLSQDPIPPLRGLLDALNKWGQQMWSAEELQRRAADEGWSSSMLDSALQEADSFRQELERLRKGLDWLERDDCLRRAFMLANRSFAQARSVRHAEWRAFQIGYLLANLASLHCSTMNTESDIVDILWFATGGGKTETYLLFILTAAFHDRLRGKQEGITAWVRFPLRMLSLQQTQRFADVIAAAELVRQEERIQGASFSLGFFVGNNGTPNRVKPDPRPGEPDPDDPDMPGRFRVLLRCPFCGSEDLHMRFDKGRWTLEHICHAAGCPWEGHPLPFYIVDEEIFRFLPTVVVGTLDKAANVSMQAAMRGFYSPPLGRCRLPDHGFSYAPRSDRPTGCLFPGCRERPIALRQDPALYPPTIRVQDELHLLRDSLGAVDSHYEALLDHLQAQWSRRPKVLASSATLAGHEGQVRALYRRTSRVFPVPGPFASRSFWYRESDRLARRFVGLSPRGVTHEFATDQLVETLQRAVRRALEDPDGVAREAGVDAKSIPSLVEAYGVNVVYGCTLKDVEAAARSFESQMRLPNVNSATLTGRTPLDEVRETLRRLTNPEPDFYERLHLVAASSMLSHGVDVDRLNVMVMLGLPLSTAEFIQTTSRVGRTYPGLVFVFHKMGRERDAAVYRIFPSFVSHADRLIDPIPITSRSRKVLELTFPGLVQGRIYGVHEPRALRAGLQPLNLRDRLRRAFTTLPVSEKDELRELVNMLDFTTALDAALRDDLQEYLREFFRRLNDPAFEASWISDLFAGGGPMRSLRDVEAQAPVYSRGDVQ